MTATTAESRRVQPTTLQETSLAQTIQFLSDPTNLDVSDTLVELWAASTEQHAEDDYVLQHRILQALLNRDVPVRVVQDAMDSCNTIHLLQAGNCLTEMFGAENTAEERDCRLDQETANLAWIAAQIGFNL